MTNRNSHVSFRLTPRSMTLDDRPQTALKSNFVGISQCWEATTAKRMNVSDGFVAH